MSVSTEIPKEDRDLAPLKRNLLDRLFDRATPDEEWEEALALFMSITEHEFAN